MQPKIMWNTPKTLVILRAGRTLGVQPISLVLVAVWHDLRTLGDRFWGGVPIWYGGYRFGDFQPQKPEPSQSEGGRAWSGGLGRPLQNPSTLPIWIRLVLRCGWPLWTPFQGVPIWYGEIPIWYGGVFIFCLVKVLQGKNSRFRGCTRIPEAAPKPSGIFPM